MPANWRDTRLPEASCPFCAHPLDAASEPSGAVPEPGYFTVCISCAQALIFDDRLVPGAPLPGELEAIYAADPKAADTVRKFQRAVRQLDRRGTPT